MYIVTWTLPHSATGYVTSHVSVSIVRELAAWTELYGIPHQIQPKTKDLYTLGCKLALDKDATWFALTWTGRKYDSIRKV